MTCTKCGGCLEQTRLEGEDETAMSVSIPAIRCINCGMYWYYMASEIERRLVQAARGKRGHIRVTDITNYNFEL